MTLDIGEVDFGARLPSPGEAPSPWLVSGWSIDTRTLQRGDLFFALRGPCHDGHAFVETATQKGAAAVVVDRPIAGIPNALVVPDTLKAMQSAARWARDKWGGRVIGVTGSAGKTSSKDIIAQLLSAAFAVGKTVGNFNNHFGVPLSILRLPDDCRVAVLEMGMNHAGEIRALAAIARPDIGVVTNVGYAHLENFDSIEGIALAKRELIEALPKEGVAVLNADDPRTLAFRRIHPGRTITFGTSASADVRADRLEPGPDFSRFEVGGVPFETPLMGRHAVSNILAGLAAAHALGIEPRRLTETVHSLTPGKMRGERLERYGVTILNDCYNANPEAVRAMLDVLGTMPARRRIAVLGEMLELGRSAEPLHRDVGNYVAAHGIDFLIGIRGASRHMVDEALRAGMSGAAYFFEDPATAGDFVRQLVKRGDAVLFKGSRGVAVEKAMEKLLASGTEAGPGA